MYSNRPSREKLAEDAEKWRREGGWVLAEERVQEKKLKKLMRRRNAEARQASIIETTVFLQMSTATFKMT